MIKLEVDDWDDIVLRAFSKALAEIADAKVNTPSMLGVQEEPPTGVASPKSELLGGTAEPAEVAGSDEVTTPPEDFPADAPKYKSLFDEEQTEATVEGVDCNGVTFNNEYCGKAAQPFYGSGKRKGQWKKRKGVDDAAYDAWYAEVLGDELPSATATPPAEINTAAAFGSAPAVQTAATSDVPLNCGTFMGWVSAKQAGGLITQAEVTQAYTALGLSVTSLFPPTPPEQVSAHIAELYKILNGIAMSRGGQNV